MFAYYPAILTIMTAQNSPYATKQVLIVLDPSDPENGAQGSFSVPWGLIEQYPRLTALAEGDPDYSRVLLLRESLTTLHALVHFLYTGSYQCLRSTTAVSDDDRQWKEMQTALRVYILAGKVGVSGLEILARDEIKRLGGQLGVVKALFNILEVVQYHDSVLGDWFPEYIDSLVTSLLSELPSTSIDQSFIKEGEVPMTSLLLNTMVSWSHRRFESTPIQVAQDHVVNNIDATVEHESAATPDVATEAASEPPAFEDPKTDSLKSKKSRSKKGKASPSREEQPSEELPKVELHELEQPKEELHVGEAPKQDTPNEERPSEVKAGEVTPKEETRGWEWPKEEQPKKEHAVEELLSSEQPLATELTTQQREGIDFFAAKKRERNERRNERRKEKKKLEKEAKKASFRKGQTSTAPSTRDWADQVEDASDQDGFGDNFHFVGSFVGPYHGPQDSQGLPGADDG